MADALEQWRAAQVATRQDELGAIVDEHDDLVRELFHLERFVSLVSYDPVDAKHDRSEPFEAFQQTHDLFAHALPDEVGSRSARRGLASRKDGRDLKGKGRELEDGPGTSARARSRQSLPGTLQRPKGTKRHSLAAFDHPVSDSIASTSTASRQMFPFPSELASLPALQFGNLPPLPRVRAAPPPPKRYKTTHVVDGVEVPITNAYSGYTHPDQIPPDPSFDGSLSAYLASYLDLDDDHTAPLTLPAEEDLEARAEFEADIKNQVEEIRRSGRVLFNPDRRASREPKKNKDHRDHLVEHAVHFAKLVEEERRSQIGTAKKVGRMVLGHFDKIKNKQDKIVRDSQRVQKALARTVMKEVKKKWKLAVDVVKSRRRERLKAEQDRLGKLQLNAMLDKSTTILQAQQIELAGVADSESEEESEEEEEEQDVPTSEMDSMPVSRSRSVRSASSAGNTPVPLPATSDDDEAAVGEDFAVPVNDEEQSRLREDDAWEADMEQDEKVELAPGEEEEDEMDGLAADAEIPIEELMRRMEGYDPGAPADGDDDESDEEREAEEEEEEDGETTPALDDESAAPLSTDAMAVDGEDEVVSDFGSNDGDLARKDEAEDEQFEEAMDDDAGEGSDDSEMDGLAGDAELTMEELMAKYKGMNGDVKDEGRDTEDNLPVEISSETGAGPSSDAEEEGEEEEQEEEEEAEEIGSEVAEKNHLRPPFLLRGSLRPYQQAGLEWLAGLYSTGVNGILADEMGLGKTIQTISLLAHLACDRGQWGPHLVVVPTSVMLNWEMEFKKFLPGFKVMTYYGTQKERKEKRKGWNADNAFNVCVTSYQLVLADQTVFRRKPWHYMILDEAHHIKNFRSQRWQTLLGFNSRHRLLLTGTPLQNNLMELWSLLYFLMPSGMSSDGQGPFADHADFQAWFSNPMEKAIENGEVMDEETKATVAKLHTVLRPYLLRRLKSEVEKQMPGKTESIIYCRLSKRQRFLYDDFMSWSQTRETLGSGQFLNIINCLMQLRKVCNHPDLFEVRPILTSFAMSRSVATDYEIKELLVRKRLLVEAPVAQMDWTLFTLIRPDELDKSSVAATRIIELDAADDLRAMHVVPEEVDLAVQPPYETSTIGGWSKYHSWTQHKAARARGDRLAVVNTRRCNASVPYFGAELLHRLRTPAREHALLPIEVFRSPLATRLASTVFPDLVKSNVARAKQLDDIVARFAFVTPKVKAADMPRHALAGFELPQIQAIEEQASAEILHNASVRLSVAFPDRSLLQYDCGKLQKLDELLRECKAGGHRVLIFTQMTKVLDILEIFLSFHGHRYLRLDGSTKIEERQIITERFNSNNKILCFISSTRSGGLGINLQGADTVIFYDSDWNPALDRQCQDRAHRIGQTREVRIWRFVTEHSIEENMLKKANQKRRLDEMVIAEGDFTTDYLAKLDWRDYLDDTQLKDLGVDETEGGVGTSAADIKNALAAAEDEEDAIAGKAAEGELEMDGADFSETAVVAAQVAPGGSQAPSAGEGSATPSSMAVEVVPEEPEEIDPLAGTVDGFMLKFVEDNFELFD